ncbi:sensor histidine kinase [Flavicella sp.]|uniref:sensor histidine kinase n=1 Tax=Flavicella sp. TaxID=2957742 RepID=UPI0030184DE8
MKRTLKNINPIILHALFWGVFILINIIFILYQKFSMFPNDTYFYRFTIEIALFYLNFSVLVPRLLLNNKIILYVFTSTSSIFLAIIVSNHFTPPPPFNLSPQDPLREFMPRPYENLLNPLRFFLYVMLIAIGTSIRLVIEWYKNEKIKKETEIQRVNTEISFLKAQLNPHFLFNTLNSIYSLANKKSDNTTESIVTLSELMRYMIYETDKDLVPLQNEINYIKNYIALQNLRLKDSRGVRINIYEPIFHKIEPLLLISFIENAFKYGTDYNGRTDIRIKIEVKDNLLLFEVSNYVSTHNRDLKNSGIGLKNVKNRLKLRYPKTHELKIEEKEQQFKVTLKIKLNT